MENLYLGIVGGIDLLIFQNRPPKIAIIHPRLRRIIILNNQIAQQRLTRRYLQRDMIQPGTFPCLSRFLRLPYVVIICHAGLFGGGQSDCPVMKEKCLINLFDFCFYKVTTPTNSPMIAKLSASSASIRIGSYAGLNGRRVIDSCCHEPSSL